MTSEPVAAAIDPLDIPGQSRSLAVEAAPTWEGIVATADEHDASLIVLGSHRRSGLVGHLLGSVAAAVVTHSTTAVLVVRQRIWHVRHEVA